MGTVAVRMTGATRRLGRAERVQTIFENVDLEVRTGEVFVLVGPSGCGKSTLLRAIAGLEPLSAGRIEVFPDGQHHRTDASMPIVVSPGISFQEPLLLPWLTVTENIALGQKFRVNRHVRGRPDVRQILQDFELSDVADAYPGELSGGQAQRASVARALAVRPTILLLDEPFGALDPVTRSSLQDWLLQTIEAWSLTVVLVTHDLAEAVRLGNRIGALDPRTGRIDRIWDGIARHAPDDPLAGRRLTEEILASYRPPGVGATGRPVSTVN